MKKLSLVILLALSITLGGQVVYSTTGSTSSGYDAVTFDTGISFNAVQNADGSVTTSWSKYSHPEAFTYYKVIRSQDTSNPVYPDDGYIYYTGNVDELTYTDTSAPAGTNYYRICEIASPARYCSSTVVTIEGGVATAYETPVPTLYETAVPTVEMVSGFNDVPVDYWAAQCVKDLATKGVVVSGEGVSFKPDLPINRAEFLKLVMQTYFADALQSGTNCYNDVSANAWYSSYVCSAKNLNIVLGYADNTFRPDRNISRAEATSILVKALRLPAVSKDILTFRDVTADWQKIVIAAAVAKNIVNGYSESAFGPNDLLLRAQGAKIMCNALATVAEPMDGEPIVTDVGPAEVPVIDGSISNTSAVIINHQNVDLAAIPSSFIEAAKSKYRIAYGHTSHGSQITTGINLIKNLAGTYSFSSDGSNGSLFYNEGLLSGDLGGDWETQTRAVLNRAGNNINLVMWSWCGQMSGMTTAQVSDYLNKMHQLEADYPNVTFVYFTGHLDGTGESGTLHKNNEQVRAFVRANNGVLFDFADIESYDPAGNYYLNRAANDNNDYTGGNWATSWCAANSSSPLCAVNACAHSQPLNCNLKGRAFWWMMARLGGWGG